MHFEMKHAKEPAEYETKVKKHSAKKHQPCLLMNINLKETFFGKSAIRKYIASYTYPLSTIEGKTFKVFKRFVQIHNKLKI